MSPSIRLQKRFMCSVFIAMLAGGTAVQAAGPEEGRSFAADGGTVHGPLTVSGHAGGEQLPDELRSKQAQPVSTAAGTEQELSRTLMIMVENSEAARPQSGLSHADLLYEVLAEGGITRFLAFYQSAGYKGAIGPVRSVRPYFLDIGVSHHAVPVHAGGSPDAYQKRSDEKIATIDEITNAHRYFWRADFRKAPHNLYTNLEKLQTGVSAMKLNRGTAPDTPVSGGQGAETAAAAVQAKQGQAREAGRLEVTFYTKQYRVEYKYNPGSGRYERFINGAAHRDREDGSPLSARTVVVLGTDHKTLDSAGRQQVRTTGTGPAYILEGGRAVSAEWKRSRADRPIRLYLDGREYKLAQQTHVLIVPVTPAFGDHVKLSAQ